MTTSLLRQFFFLFFTIMWFASDYIREENGKLPGGGGTWVFFGWVCAARDSKLAPRIKKKNLKLIARPRNGPIF